MLVGYYRSAYDLLKSAKVCSELIEYIELFFLFQLYEQAWDVSKLIMPLFEEYREYEKYDRVLACLFEYSSRMAELLQDLAAVFKLLITDQTEEVIFNLEFIFNGIFLEPSFWNIL